MNNMPELIDYFASCPKHLELLLRDELESFGCNNVKQTVAGVFFSGDLKTLYKVCLGSRLANRVLMPIARDKAKSAREIYQLVYDTPWENYFTADRTFVINFIGTNSEIKNTQFGAQKVKDAIVDRFMYKQSKRPSIDKKAPDIRINVRLTNEQTIVSLDMSGESLHKRGYRIAQGDAPLKENLASAILIRAGWPQLVSNARAESRKIGLIDPMCGSGTFLVEAALMAANIAPGLLRKKFGFEKLLIHNQALWSEVIEAAAAAEVDLQEDNFPMFYGEDRDEKVLSFARTNVKSANIESVVNIQSGTIGAFTNPFGNDVSAGIMVCNPPYGERLGDIESLREDYRILGQAVKRELSSWDIAVLTSNTDLVKEMRLRPKNRYKFFNGTIAAELVVFNILAEGGQLREDIEFRDKPLSEGAQMVANRLLKNSRKLSSWIKKNNISCYRLYDADMPEYSAAIDVYDDYYHVQEYQAPKNVDENKARKRFEEIIHAVRHAFSVESEKVISKTRQRHRGKSQYQKLNHSDTTDFMAVSEGKASLFVNLTDYLDTGLFLDHRPLRKRLSTEAKHKRFLNLFCYTATATVQAAIGGAESSVSVDMSNTYLKWAEENFALNNIPLETHQLVRGDVVTWLKNCRQGFDIIMLDPPSFSNSKNTNTVLDIQKDHVRLILRCMEILNPNGTLYFSNNLRSFKLDMDALSAVNVEDISAQTLDPDFQRNAKIHRCWKMQHA